MSMPLSGCNAIDFLAHSKKNLAKVIEDQIKREIKYFQTCKCPCHYGFPEDCRCECWGGYVPDLKGYNYQKGV